ncbi:hypothetical protein, partial [Porphyromonas macacae]
MRSISAIRQEKHKKTTNIKNIIHTFRGAVSKFIFGAASFFYSSSNDKAPTFTSQGFVRSLSLSNLANINYLMNTKLHFRPYISDPILLFPAELGQDIDANDPVRLVNSIVDSLNLESIQG